MFCPKCGATLPDNAQFCGSCGNKIDAQGAAAAQQPTPAAPPYATGGAAVARRGIPKAAVAAGLALIVVAAVVAAGLLTNWFGLANSPVYVLTKSTEYAASGDKSHVVERELDDRGSVVKKVTKTYSADETSTYTAEYENDRNGFPEKAILTEKTTGSDKTTETMEYKNEFDNQGRLTQTKTKSDSQTGTVSYEYYGNGNVKAVKEETEAELSTGGTNLSFYSKEYDELGYITSYTAEITYEGSEMGNADYKFEWAFGSSNDPTGFGLSTKSTDASNDRKGIGDLTVETDGHGNITAIYDEDDNLVAEYEYELVNNPSTAALRSASKKPYAVRVSHNS